MMERRTEQHFLQRLALGFGIILGGVCALGPPWLPFVAGGGELIGAVAFLVIDTMNDRRNP